MNLAEYKGVYVFAQQVDNQISSIALELIGKGKDLAKDLGTTVTAVLVGSNVKGLADELGEYGADKVIVVDDPELKEYRNPNNPENIPNVERAFRMIALILTQRNDGVKVELKGIRKKEAEKAS